MAVNLTSGAIQKIVTGECNSDNLKPVVQVIMTGSTNNKQWYGVVLSDGSFQHFGVISDEIFIEKDLQKGSIVQFTKYHINKSRNIIIFDLNVIHRKYDIIGKPEAFFVNGTPSMQKSIPPISDHDRVDPDVNEDVDDSHHVEEPRTSKQIPSACHSLTQNKKRKRQSSNDDISGFGKDISRFVSMTVEKTIEDGLGACYKKLETLEEGVSKMTRMMMEKSQKTNEIDVGFKKLETLEEDVSKLSRMMMEKNKEDDMGACIEKLDKMGWGAEEQMYVTALLLFGQSADYRKLWLHLKPESCGKWVKNAGSMFRLLDG